MTDSSPSIRLHIRYFATYRDILGRRDEMLDMPIGTSALDVWDHVIADRERLIGLRGVTRFARNGTYYDPAAPLESGDELAFLPPVSGGAPTIGSRFAIVQDALSLDSVSPLVQTDSDGAVVGFLGVVRNRSDTGRPVVALDYDAYESMALAMLKQVGHDIEQQWPDVRLAIHHRTGYLPVGEASVAIAAASPHRDNAFAACALAIKKLKDYVPIWKREVYADGESTWLGQRS